jgi:hypothetical protein
VRRGGADPGLGGGPVQLAAQGVRGDPAALVGEQWAAPRFPDS